MTKDHFAKEDAPAAHFAESDQQESDATHFAVSAETDATHFATPTGSDATHFAVDQSSRKSGKAKLFWICVIAGVLCLVAAAAILVYAALEYGIPIYYSGILWSN